MAYAEQKGGHQKMRCFAVPHLITAALRCLRKLISAAEDTPGRDEILRSRSLGIVRLHDGDLVPVRRLHAASSRQLSCGLQYDFLCHACCDDGIANVNMYVVTSYVGTCRGFQSGAID